MRNLSMMTDLYQLTMMQGYYEHGMHENLAAFDLFFRRPPQSVSYAVAAGLEEAIDYIDRLSFDEHDIAYLASLGIFRESFLNWLRTFRFTGDIDAIPEGTMVFPQEPLVRVTAPIAQAQLVETALLNLINHQTLIATKASRVVEAAGSDGVLEFGLRRAQGPDAGIYGARASIIGGCAATSNVMTGQMFGIPVRGTHAHSWVMSFPDELSSFRAYAKVFPRECLLLVDTYDTLKSGVPNAIKVFEELRTQGIEPVGIRLDSGDLAYLSRQARKMLDAAGFTKARIYASGDLDEKVIWDLKAQGAAIDVWGVGTRLITSDDQPALGGVYKLAAERVGDTWIPKMKVSDNPAKMTNPGLKRLWRIYDDADMAQADLIGLEDDVIDTAKPLNLFDPLETWKRMTLEDYSVRDMLVPIYRQGQKVYESPPLPDIAAYAKAERATFWQQYRRLSNPHVYKVDLSTRLWQLRQTMLSGKPAPEGAVPDLQ